MIIDCISDLHGHFPKLEGGDLLIVAGDLTARDTPEEYLFFFHWLQDQKYRKIVFIAGNHDHWIEKNQDEWKCITPEIDIQYLCDSGTEFEGLKIWGSPWTKTFPGMNPDCMAFTEPFGCDQEEWLAERWALIPDDTDILITHSPPFGILDRCYDGELAGSKPLRDNIFAISPIISIFGHIHENGGKQKNVLLGNDIDAKFIQFINCSHVNEKYQAVNKPVRVIL